MVLLWFCNGFDLFESSALVESLLFSCVSYDVVLFSYGIPMFWIYFSSLPTESLGFLSFSYDFVWFHMALPLY